MKRTLALLWVALFLLSGCARTPAYPEPAYLVFQEGEFSLVYPDWPAEPDQDPGALLAVTNGALGVWLRTYPGYPQFALRLAKGYIERDPQQELLAASDPEGWPLWLEQEADLGEIRVRTRTTYYYANGKTYALIVSGEAGAYEAARPLWERLWSSVQVGLSQRLPRPQTGRLGLAINPAQQDYGRYDDAVRQAAEAGVQVSQLTFAWGQIETQAGRYDWTVLDDLIAAGRGHGLVISLQVPLPDGASSDGRPAGLGTAPLSDPALRERWLGFLSALAARYGEDVRYLTLGREVEPYLATHPGEADALAALFAASRQTVKEQSPQTLVGVGLGPVQTAQASTAEPFAAADFVAYSLDVRNARVRPGAEPAEALDRALALAGDRPVAITEAGFPSGPELGGSEEAQAAYVQALLPALSERSRGILFLSWAFLHDDAPIRCAGSTPSPACSAGLLDAAGNPKPAWAAFTQGVRTHLFAISNE